MVGLKLLSLRPDFSRIGKETESLPGEILVQGQRLAHSLFFHHHKARTIHKSPVAPVGPNEPVHGSPVQQLRDPSDLQRREDTDQNPADPRSRLCFHEATALTCRLLEGLQRTMRIRLLRHLRRHGLLEPLDAQEQRRRARATP